MATRKTATKNGHGGARKGAGRPREGLPVESLARIGPRPVNDPMKLTEWYGELLAELLDLHVRTGKFSELIGNVRATVAVLAKSMPPRLMIEANRVLRAEESELNDTESVEEEPNDKHARAVRIDDR